MHNLRYRGLRHHRALTTSRARPIPLHTRLLLTWRTLQRLERTRGHHQAEGPSACRPPLMLVGKLREIRSIPPKLHQHQSFQINGLVIVGSHRLRLPKQAKRSVGVAVFVTGSRISNAHRIEWDRVRLLAKIPPRHQRNVVPSIILSYVHVSFGGLRVELQSVGAGFASLFQMCFAIAAMKVYMRCCQSCPCRSKF